MHTLQMLKDNNAKQHQHERHTNYLTNVGGHRSEQVT